MVQSENITNRCGRCNGTLVTTFEEEVCCSKCGYVVVEQAYDLETDESKSRELGGWSGRTGPASSNLSFDSATSSIISKINKDAQGKNLNSNQRSTMDRLRTWDSRSMNSNPKSRNFIKAFTDLANVCNKLKIPDNVKERAAEIYRESVERKLIRGRTINTLIAASLYLAVRETSTPRSLTDVAREAGVNKKDISANYRMLVTEFEIVLPIMNPRSYTSKIGTLCEPQLSEKVIKMANQVIEYCEENTMDTHGKDPVGFAAACLYTAGKVASLLDQSNVYDTTQRKISLAANVTEVTVRNRCKGINLIAQKIWPDAYAWDEDMKDWKLQNMDNFGRRDKK